MQNGDEGPAFARYLILLVEDEVLLRHELAQHLRLAGYEVVEARNGEEAGLLVRTGTTAAVLITDIRMPGSVDGLLLAGYVRRQTPHTKIIIMSGDLPASSGVADAAFAKPLYVAALLAKVQELVGARCHAREQKLA
jgi:two-component system, response regulator PdtaR